MFSLKCLNLRTDDGGMGPVPEETNLTISLQPIRINIDQVRLFLLPNFFYFFQLNPEFSGHVTLSRRLFFICISDADFKPGDRRFIRSSKPIRG